RARDHSAAPLQSISYAGPVVAALAIGLHDAAQQEDLVVHGNPKQHTEHQYGERGFYVTERPEAEESAEEALLEDEHQCAKARGNAECVHDDRFERKHHRAE